MAAQQQRAMTPGTAARRRATGPARRAGPPAALLPVARVAVDVPLPHLDRPFDYLVPERMAGAAQRGVRVRVRFAGQLTGGYVLERVAASGHSGRLSYLERVVSPEPVLTPEIAALARELADRYAGTLADVLRLAIPPRHAAAEKRQAPPEPGGGPPEPGRPAPGRAGECPPAPLERLPPLDRPPRRPEPPGMPEPGPWTRYPAGAAFLAALAGGRGPRAVWSALPGQDWPREIAVAAATAAAARRGALMVVPDAGDLGLLDSALTAALGPGRHVCLTAGLGPAERYRRWLAALRGGVRVVAGTRAAMFAPVRDLGLVVVWDDGDDLHAEPRAPYPHAREVLALRAHRTGAAALIGGFARTAEATSLVASGWAAAITPARPVVRRYAPRIRAAGDDAELARDEAARSARIPGLALRTARDGLTRGPVLVQVPRRGYVTAVACENCRARARCPVCGGPLAVEESGSPAACRWCGRAGSGWRCHRCGHPRIRAVIIGAGRTAEELGRAFPGARVLVSGGGDTLGAVGPQPALVVATPGAEPRVPGGYAAAVLLDGWVLLARASLRATEETLRRWLNAAALVAPATSGGAVTVVADAALPAVQALIRWDPVTHAERELAERTELGFPPAVKMAALTGPGSAVTDLLAAAGLPPGAEVLGPIALDGPARTGVDGSAGGGADAGGGSGAGGDAGTGKDQGMDGGDEPGGDGGVPAGLVRALVRVPRSGAMPLAMALRAAQGARSARKAAGAVRVQFDPAELI